MRITVGLAPGRLGGRTRAKATRALVALQLALASPAVAQQGVEALFPPRPAGYVTDVAGALDPGSVAAMTERIGRLRDLTGAEIAVVTLPTIGDRAAVDVAVAIGRAWGVGAAAAIGDQRRDAGLVVLLVPRRADDPNSGQIFIATGRGLEGIVTDAAAGRVRDQMRPDLAAGRYGEGLRRGVEALAAMIADGMGVSDSTLAAGSQAIRRGDRGSGLLLVLVVFVVIVVVLVVAGAMGSRRGPPPPGIGGRRRRPRRPQVFLGGPGWGGGFGGFGGGMGGGGFGGFGGGGGFSGGGAGGRF